MRTLFLDFDGPLHPITAIEGLVPSAGLLSSDVVRTHGLFRWVDKLDQALAGHDDVAIVVHSAWASYASNQELRQVLGPLASRFVGITPRDQERWPGIREVVERFGIETYRVLDDAVHRFPADLPELIAVDPLLGLSEDAPLKALRTWLKESAVAVLEESCGTPSRPQGLGG